MPWGESWTTTTWSMKSRRGICPAEEADKKKDPPSCPPPHVLVRVQSAWKTQWAFDNLSPWPGWWRCPYSKPEEPSQRFLTQPVLHSGMCYYGSDRMLLSDAGLFKMPACNLPHRLPHWLFMPEVAGEIHPHRHRFPPKVTWKERLFFPELFHFAIFCLLFLHKSQNSAERLIRTRLTPFQRREGMHSYKLKNPHHPSTCDSLCNCLYQYLVMTGLWNERTLI